MTLSEYRGRLLNVPFINDLPGPLRERVAMCLFWIGQPAQFAVGDTIFVQGNEDENTGCALLLGEVEVLRDSQAPVRVPAPDLVGEMQQLEPTAQRTATVQVTLEAQTLLFSWHDFVACLGMVLTPNEQVVLRDVIRASATHRQRPQ